MSAAKTNKNRFIYFLFFVKCNLAIFKEALLNLINFKKSELINEGILIKKNYLNKNESEKILKEIKRIENNPSSLKKNSFFNIRNSFDGEENYDSGMIDIINYNKSNSQILKQINIKRIEKIIEKELGFKLFFSGLNIYINKGIIDTRSFHVDSFGAKQHKAFIYLTDVPNESFGPYCYVKKSHKPSINKFRNLWSNYLKKLPLTDMRTYNDKNVIKCLGNKGDLIISSQDGYHRGWPQQKNKKRYLIALRFKK